MEYIGEFTINIKTSKKCAICKYWYDPNNEGINPKSPQINIWEFDNLLKKICLQTGIHMQGSGFCNKYCCKLDIL